MRVIAGEQGGRRLKSLEGRDTRPTTDRVKEAMMSSVASAREGGFAGCSVLDAFAGSGALGIEALSRGASQCIFLERSGKALALVKENLASLGLEAPRALVRKGDACKLAGKLEPASGSFDVVFLDPPYALGPQLVPGLLASLAGAGLLSSGALVVYEHAQGGLDVPSGDCPFPQEEALQDLSLSSQRTYGNTQVSILVWSPQPQAMR